jgi:hypothetical protein
MLSDRARWYLSTLKRQTPVSTEVVERVLKEQGVPCHPAWLDFHERYAGYVEPLGLESAVLGLVHERSKWIVPMRAAVQPSYESSAAVFVTCAEAHPSYVYQLGDNGFFRAPAAASFDVKLERSAARVSFFKRPGARSVFGARVQALYARLCAEASVCPEASDEHYQLLVGDRHFALRESSTERVVDCAVCN